MHPTSMAALVLLAACALPVWSQAPGVVAGDTTTPVVLLARGDSYLERAVSEILADSLTRRGFLLELTDVRDIAKVPSKRYRAVVLFRAIDARNQIDPSMKAFAQTLQSRGSHVLICTTYGEPWNGGRNSVDAVAAATKSLNPRVVAGNILRALLSPTPAAPDSSSQASR